MDTKREQLIRQRLNETLNPISLELIDDSHMHAGHGAKGGHYTVKIVAEAFAGKSMIQRHRLVYDALAELMSSEIHALSIHASTPAEKQDS
jgi:BolA protein